MSWFSACCPQNAAQRQFRDAIQNQTLDEVAAANRHARAQKRVDSQRALRGSVYEETTESPLMASADGPSPASCASAADMDAAAAEPEARKSRYDRGQEMAIEMAARARVVSAQPEAIAPEPAPTTVDDLVDLGGAEESKDREPVPPIVDLLIRNEQILLERDATKRKEAASLLFGEENQADVDAKLKQAGVAPDTLDAELRRCAPVLETL